MRTMATNFHPCKGSYVLSQFPSDVMFGMNGFHVSANGAIQGHHGPLVILLRGIELNNCLNLEFVGNFGVLSVRLLFYAGRLKCMQIPIT